MHGMNSMNFCGVVFGKHRQAVTEDACKALSTSGEIAVGRSV
jgi:hypothetical protein